MKNIIRLKMTQNLKIEDILEEAKYCYIKQLVNIGTTMIKDAGEGKRNSEVFVLEQYSSIVAEYLDKYGFKNSLGTYCKYDGSRALSVFSDDFEKIVLSDDFQNDFRDNEKYCRKRETEEMIKEEWQRILNQMSTAVKIGRTSCNVICDIAIVERLNELCMLENMHTHIDYIYGLFANKVSLKISWDHLLIDK